MSHNVPNQSEISDMDRAAVKQRRASPLNYDMFDGEVLEEIAAQANTSAPHRWERLRVNLLRCREQVQPTYVTSDNNAMRFQFEHRIITLTAAVSGTIAVLLAIAQLTMMRLSQLNHDFIPPEGLLRSMEIGAVLVTSLAVITGLITAFQHKWLRERFKAERLRLVKFRFLIDPALWGSDSDAIAKRLRALEEEVARIARVKTTGLERWVEENLLPIDTTEESEYEVDSATLLAIKNYYIEKRLDVELDFFNTRGSIHAKQHRSLRRLPPMLFFLSIMFVLFHFAIDLFASPETQPTRMWLLMASPICIGLAAALPALGAGIRTYLAAHEPSRHAIRYLSAYNALKEVEKRLATAQETEVVFKGMQHSEEILALEHREWLLLMIDAEWFG